MPINNQEVKALIAPILGLSVEDIDDFIIITRGLCTDCGMRDEITSHTNIPGFGDFAGLIHDGLLTRMDGG